MDDNRSHRSNGMIIVLGYSNGLKHAIIRLDVKSWVWVFYAGPSQTHKTDTGVKSVPYPLAILMTQITRMRVRQDAILSLQD